MNISSPDDPTSEARDAPPHPGMVWIPGSRLSHEEGSIYGSLLSTVMDDEQARLSPATLPIGTTRMRNLGFGIVCRVGRTAWARTRSPPKQPGAPGERGRLLNGSAREAIEQER